jgi:hypothetical protein
MSVYTTVRYMYHQHYTYIHTCMYILYVLRITLYYINITKHGRKWLNAVAIVPRYWNLIVWEGSALQVNVRRVCSIHTCMLRSEREPYPGSPNRRYTYIIYCVCTFGIRYMGTHITCEASCTCTCTN